MILLSSSRVIGLSVCLASSATKSTTLFSNTGARRRGERLRVLAVVVVDLLLLAREAADLGDQRLLVLVLGHFDLVLVADLGDHQPEAHAALGDLAVLLAGGFLGRALVLERAAVAARPRA